MLYSHYPQLHHKDDIHQLPKGKEEIADSINIKMCLFIQLIILLVVFTYPQINVAVHYKQSVPEVFCIPYVPVDLKFASGHDSSADLSKGPRLFQRRIGCSITKDQTSFIQDKCIVDHGWIWKIDKCTDLLCDNTPKQDLVIDRTKIKFNFEKGNSSTFLEMTTVGGRMFFMVGVNNDLVTVWVKQRLALPLGGQVIFTQSSCMVNLGQCCICVICAIKLSKDMAFKLAVISSLYDMRIDAIYTLQYYKWAGTISCSRHPECFYCHSWDTMKSDFTRCSVCVDDISTPLFWLIKLEEISLY